MPHLACDVLTGAAMTKKPASRRGRSSSAPPPALAETPAAVDLLADRHQLVQREAYLIAERRGFAPGNELADWLEAERIVDARA